MYAVDLIRLIRQLMLSLFRLANARIAKILAILASTNLPGHLEQKHIILDTF